LLEAADHFYNPTTAPNQLWQTDFTYFKIKHWCWYYLSTVLDDYSRYILAWELCPGMQATDVERTVQEALQASSLTASQRPRILRENHPKVPDAACCLDQLAFLVRSGWRLRAIKCI
jgi:transposase InsO family protein